MYYNINMLEIIMNKENNQIIKKHRLDLASLNTCIADNYTKYFNHQPYKIKDAHGLTYLDMPIKEFKIHFNQQYYRIGYVDQMELIQVILISDEIIKEKFVKKLKKVKGVK